MIGVYFICFLLFPYLVISSIQFTKQDKENVIEKNDAVILRGIAAILVILAHYTNSFSNWGGVLRLYRFCGGIGVLIFFFLSGFGIYCSNVDFVPNTNFLWKRFKNVYLPYVLMKFVFNGLNIIQVGSGEIQLRNIWFNIFGLDKDDWFIKIIIIQYIIFFIVWKFFKKKYILGFTGVICLAVSIMFCFLQYDPRWYNGLMLFWAGMVLAKYKKEFILFTQNFYILKLTVLFLLFIVMALIFWQHKGYIWAEYTKTISGIFLCIGICTALRRIDLNSKILKWFGERSLYLYIVHINIWIIAEKVLGNRILYRYYISVFATLILTELFYFTYRGILALCTKKIKL